MTTLITWMLCIRIGSGSGWWLVYYLVPGAKAIRAVTRYQIFLVAPIVLVVTCQLARTRIGDGAVAAAIAILLLVEEVNSLPSVGVEPRREVARLQRIGAPPRERKSFFVSSSREDGLYGPEVDARYSHNVDAMIVAETNNIPTINGFASFAPNGWNLFAPDAPDYRDRVAAYAARYRVEGLC
jgi:hypothetical protein